MIADLIDQTWNFEDPASSEARFRALAEERLEGGDANGSGELLTQAARAQGLQGKMTEATSTLNDVETRTKGAPPVLRVRIALERGRVLNSSKQPEQARPYFERAFETARAAHLDALAVDAAHMIAITYLATPDDSIRWNDEAIALARASTDPRGRRWLASLSNNRGWSYFEKKKCEEALASFQEALGARRQGTDVQARRVADWAVGRALRALGRTQDALAVQEGLRREYEEAGKTSGFVFEELGECYLALGDLQRAAPWFASAYAELSRNPRFAESEQERLARISRLAGRQDH